jgi:hypothetical protein
MKAQKIMPPNNTQAQVLKNWTQVLTNLTRAHKNPQDFSITNSFLLKLFGPFTSKIS